MPKVNQVLFQSNMNVFESLRTLKTLKNQFNLTLGLTCLLLISSSFTWGFDNQGYATIQAMDSYVKQFGVLNHKTGEYSIPPKFLSYLNSFQYFGFVLDY